MKMADKNSTNDVPETEDTKSSLFKPTSIVGIVLIAAIIAIIVLSSLTYVKTVSDENTISMLREQLFALQTQLSTARTELDTLTNKVTVADAQIGSLSDKEASDVSSLQDKLSSANELISSLSSQINSVVSQITSLQTDIYSDTGTIASIQSQLNSIGSQVSTLSSTTTSLQNALTSLENTVDLLIEQVNELTAAATNPVILFSSRAVSQAFGSQTLLYTFTPTYNGYIYISSSTTGYIRATNNTTSTYTDYAFGTGTTVSAAVIGGYNYSIRFGNSEASGTITATLTAIYYPTSSSTTNSIPLFTSKTISQAHSTQTLLYTFTPTYNGYIYISGTSSSTTGYIRLINNSTSTFTDYAFGTGTTINAVVNAGYSYSLVFGNSDASGLITATLSAIYYY
jgi:peptidoglycan hydrolase CwlO-like protein